MQIKLVKYLVLCYIALFFSFNVYAQSEISNLPDFVGIIENNSPGVVNISTTHSQKEMNFKLPPGLEGTPQGELFRKFFDDQNQQNRDALSLGSGAIISADGYIVTNNHVVADADKILVKLSDKREFPAKVIGIDTGTDIALLKINAKDLPFLKLGNSDELKIGEWVVAIGSPFGFEYTSTTGIVSAKGRSIGRERYVPFIQTDVAINPGNSGGPLFNLKGELIGINAQILSKSGGYLGLSFAIPSNVVRNVATQLKERGYVDRGWLGIAFQSIDRDLAKSFGLDRAQGALVANVVPSSPADKAGIKTGDIIIKFNGDKVLDAGQLPYMVGNVSPGNKVGVVLFRNNKEVSVDLTIGQMKPDSVADVNKDKNVDKEYGRLGVLVRDLDRAERRDLKIPTGAVVIAEVKPDSIAESIGLAVSDIVMAINMKEITDVDQFTQLVNSLSKDKWIPILIMNQDGVKRYFAFKIEE